MNTVNPVNRDPQVHRPRVMGGSPSGVYALGLSTSLFTSGYSTDPIAGSSGFCYRGRVPSKEWTAAQVFVVSLRLDSAEAERRQASHAPLPLETSYELSIGRNSLAISSIAISRSARLASLLLIIFLLAQPQAEA